MKKTTLFIVTLIIASGMVLSACGMQGSSASLAGTSWKLVSFGPAKNQAPAASGVQTNLDFGKDGTVSGSFGCNSFSGNYQVQNGDIVFSQVISTMMACAGPQTDQETTAFKVIRGTARFTIAGNTLTIYAASGDNVLTFSK